MNCTIYANTSNAEQIIDVITSIVDVDTLSMELDEHENWSAIQHESDSVKVMIRRMNRRSSGEQFSNLVLTTYKYIEQIEAKTSAGQQNKVQLMERISASNLILGIVAEPEFTEAAEDMVFGLAEASSGVVFTGDAFFNTAGGLILDVEGTSEESVDAK